MTDPVREVAFEVLRAVLERRRTLEEGLGVLGVEARDRAAGHRLGAAVLRRYPSLEAVMEPGVQRAPPEGVRQVLRIGAAGLLLLGVPAHAAVDTAVGLARARGFGKFAGMVNAVLRRVAEGGAEALLGVDGARVDTPAWLWASWGAGARGIAEAHGVEAPLDVMGKEGAAPGGEGLPGGGWRFAAGTRVVELPGFGEGEIWVQDVAASLPARLLGVGRSERVADLCAAPGGKTAQLCLAGGRVVAVERDGGRMGRLRENLGRLGLGAELVQADAVGWGEAGSFVAVLLVAPCTATGTIRRHPDVMRLRRPLDVGAMVAGQWRLLAAAARLVRPGGRVVYAVCSLQGEEGEGQIGAAEGMGLRLDRVGVEEVAVEGAVTAGGWVRTVPSMWAERGGMDGFFAARFVKA